MKKVCPICNKLFEAKKKSQLYCCVYCRKIHHKRVYYDKNRDMPIYEFEKILRVFECKKCKKIVLVTNKLDRRTKFCSPRCEKLYWKHPELHKDNKKN